MCAHTGYKRHISIRVHLMIEFMSVLTVMLLAERVQFAILCLIWHFMGCGSDKRSMWFVSTVFQSTITFVSGVMSALSRLISFSFRGLLWCVVMMVCWGCLYVVSQHSVGAMLAFQRVYNSDMGGFLRMVLYLPMQLLQLLWDGVIPMYNLLVYSAKTIPIRVLLENVMQDFGDFKSCVLELGNAIYALLMSVSAYVFTWVTPPDSFDAGLRILDLLTPLGHFRLFVSYLLVWMGQMCSIMMPLFDWAAYLFMDINFGEGVHYLVNSVLFLVTQVPLITIQRCRAGAGDLVYCLPDFEPVFQLAVQGVRGFGFGIDNWLDVTMIIVQAALTGTSPTCAGWTVIDFHTGGGANDTLMGSNQTVVAGISAYEFVKTDGWNAEIYTRTTVQQFPGIFPFPARLDYSVAIVTASQDAKGLLGCQCTDMDFGMQITCAVAPLHSGESWYLVPVEFQIPTTSFYMGCARSKIKVDSIRWPVTRYTAAGAKSPVSPVAEAAIWVRPFCSSEFIDIVCIETFALAGCFPYCMGLWTKGYKGSIVLRDASEWVNSVSMVDRDCGLHTWDVASGTLAAVTTKLRQNSGVTNIWMNSQEVQLNNSECVYSGATLSRLLKTTVPAYSVYRSVDLTNQPFAFAGDLVLTAVQTSTANTWGVKVSRLWGNQVSLSMCVEIANLNFATSSSVSGAHCSMSSMHFLICSSGSCILWRSMSAVALSTAARRSSVGRSLSVGASSLESVGDPVVGDNSRSKNATSTSAMILRVSSDAVRLGTVSSSCIAFAKLMSLRGCFLWASCLNVRRVDVSGLVPIRARVCDAFLRSRRVRTLKRSRATMRLSSVTLTLSEGPIASNDMVRIGERVETVVL